MSISKEALRELYISLDQEMRASHQRSLPFEEYIFDRFERAASLSAGKNSSVHHSCYTYGEIEIGADTWVGPFTLLDGSGGLKIGDNCSISSGVQIYSHDSVMKRISGGRSPIEKSPVQIGNSCYIGPQAIIAKGVSLGNFTIVGANSFVAKSFPDHSVVVGSPAVLKGHVRFNSNNQPFIQWIPSKSFQDQINMLEEKIKNLQLELKK